MWGATNFPRVLLVNREYFDTNSDLDEACVISAIGKITENFETMPRASDKMTSKSAITRYRGCEKTMGRLHGQ